MSSPDVVEWIENHSSMNPEDDKYDWEEGDDAVKKNLNTFYDGLSGESTVKRGNKEYKRKNKSSQLKGFINNSPGTFTTYSEKLSDWIKYLGVKSNAEYRDKMLTKAEAKRSISGWKDIQKEMDSKYKIHDDLYDEIESRKTELKTLEREEKAEEAERKAEEARKAETTKRKRESAEKAATKAKSQSESQKIFSRLKGADTLSEVERIRDSIDSSDVLTDDARDRLSEQAEARASMFTNSES